MQFCEDYSSRTFAAIVKTPGAAATAAPYGSLLFTKELILIILLCYSKQSMGPKQTMWRASAEFVARNAHLCHILIKNNDFMPPCS